MNEKYLDRVVLAKYGTGEEKGLFLVRTYAEHPTYTLEREDGTQFSWAAHLCAPASGESEAKYWRQRALRAEKALNQQDPPPPPAVE